MSTQTTGMVLDLKGLLCPMPVIKLAKAIKDIPVGEIIEAFATDPGVMADIPAWCRTTGNELVTLEKNDKQFRFVVRRVK
ncbi:MAG: sulfurtransferase TusA family protein [Anaerolineales bacterium]|nr:MAG: sulfurtransferase TusA family protein [Anaerolineales bacterium]